MFIAGLAFLPLSSGKANVVGAAVSAMWFCGLVATYEMWVMTKGRAHAVGVHKFWVPAALFGAVLIWILIQNSTGLPESWHHPIWAMTAEALDNPVSGSISVNRDLTTIALIRLITAGSVFWIAAQLCRDGARAHRLLVSIAAVVAIYAAYQLVSFAALSDPIHGSTKPLRSYVSALTFRDSYAVYAGIGLIVISGLLVKLYRYDLTTVGGSLRFRISSIIEATGQKGALLFAAAFLIAVTLLLTGSYDGIVATSLGLLALLIVSFTRLGKTKRSLGKAKSIRGAALIGIAIFAAALLLAEDPTVGKIEEEGVAGDSRVALWLITLRSILDSPWLGYGYGTFADVFDMVRDRSVSTRGVWATAHNGYLELFQGLGLIAGPMLIICIVLLLRQCLKGATTRSRFSVVPAVATGVGFLIGIQAIVGSAVQFQAVTLTFTALLGAGVAQSQRSTTNLHD